MAVMPDLKMTVEPIHGNPVPDAETIAQQYRVSVTVEPGPETDRDAAAVTSMYADVQRFNTEILGLEMPMQARVLNDERLQWALAAFREEIAELEVATDAGDVVEAADAVVDLIVFALGRLHEMGVPPRAVFDAVHQKNMEKRRGELAKRPGSQGYDAIKPEGWTPPDHSWLSEITLADIVFLRTMSPVLREVAELRAKKGQDYNAGPSLRDYFPFGHQSYAQMVYLKAVRVLSLLAVLGQGRAPNFEGLEDTLKDMINYATFYLEWLRDQRTAGASA